MRLATCRRDRLLGCFFLTKTLPYYRPTPKVATPSSAALDSHFFSEANVNTCQARGIDSNIITGRELNHRDWHTFFQEQLSHRLKRPVQRSR